MDFGKMYESYGGNVTVSQILDSAKCLPDVYQTHLFNRLGVYDTDEHISRETFIDTMNDIQEVAVSNNTPKVNEMVSLFENLNDCGRIHKSSLYTIFGDKTEVVVDQESYTLSEFIETFKGFFDDNGNISKSLLNQIQRLSIKSMDNQYEEVKMTIEMEREKQKTKFKKKEKDLLSDLEVVEEDREFLASELEKTKKALRDAKKELKKKKDDDQVDTKSSLQSREDAILVSDSEFFSVSEELDVEEETVDETVQSLLDEISEIESFDVGFEESKTPEISATDNYEAIPEESETPEIESSNIKESETAEITSTDNDEAIPEESKTPEIESLDGFKESETAEISSTDNHEAIPNFEEVLTGTIVENPNFEFDEDAAFLDAVMEENQTYGLENNYGSNHLELGTESWQAISDIIDQDETILRVHDYASALDGKAIYETIDESVRTWQNAANEYKLPETEDYIWYRNYNRKRAERFVKSKELGSFVVRPTKHHSASYALTIRGHDRILHYLIKQQPDKNYALFWDDTNEFVQPGKSDVEKLLDYFSKYKVNENTPKLKLWHT